MQNVFSSLFRYCTENFDLNRINLNVNRGNPEVDVTGVTSVPFLSEITNFPLSVAPMPFSNRNLTSKLQNDSEKNSSGKKQ